MGAETSILDDCNLDDPIEDPSICRWVLRHGQLADESLVTIFSDQRNDREQSELMKRNIKNLKSLRHPNLLRFLASGEKSGHRYVVTERVVPLCQVLESLDSVEVCAGLYSILEGLIFLHNKAGVSHNNVCLESIFVTETGQWKLGGLECTCSFSLSTADFLQSTRKYRNEKFIAPEEKSGKVEKSIEHGHSRDVYSFAILAETLMEYMLDLGDATKTFEVIVSDECENEDPKLRPKLEILLNNTLFRNDFLSILGFLQTITLKSVEEKRDFFEEVLYKLLKLPEETVGKCLTRLLLCRFVLLDRTAQDLLLPHVLMPCRGSKRAQTVSETGAVTPLFRNPTYIKYVIPELTKIFYCHDYHIRMVLLTHFSHYVDLFDKDTLEDVILPQVLLGIRDTHEDLAALSLHCLANLVPLLGRDIVIGGKSKTYFIKGMPNFKRQNMPKANGEMAYNNVNSAMEKVPVLLKDLAKLSTKHKASEWDIEMERKKKEREQKLQEAKLRRDQRKQEHQWKSSKAEQSKDKDAATENSTTKHVHFADEHEHDNVSEVTAVDIPNDDYQDNYNNDKDYDDEEEMIIEDDEIIVEDDNEDWSGWGDDLQSQDDNNDLNLDSSDTVSSAKVKDDFHSSLDNDSFNKESIHSHPNYMDDLPSEITMNSVASDWNSLESSAIVSKLQNKNSKALSLASKNKKKKPDEKKKELGSEFDIKNIEVKLSEEKETEFDFFADMKPEIKVSKSSDILGSKAWDKVDTDQEKTGVNLKSSPAKLESEQETIAPKTKIDLSYNLTEMEGEAEGWGDDDLNWGEDDGF